MPYQRLSSAELAAMGGAFAAGYEAERAQQLFVPELSFTPSMDLSLALGWPFLLELEPPSGAADPVQATLDRLAVDLPARRWPVDLATRAVRLLAFGYVKFPEPKPAAIEAASSDAPFARSEVKSILGTYFARPVPGWRHAPWLLGALEALGDSAAVLETMLDTLEAGLAGTSPWGPINAKPSALVKLLAHVIRRLSPTDAEPFRARAGALLSAVVEKRPTVLSDDKYRLVPYRGLALLSGDEDKIRAGAARIDGQLLTRDAMFLSRTSFLEVMRALGPPTEGEQPSAQWVVVGGAEVLDIELRRWHGYGVNMDKPAAHAYLLDQYGVFRLDGAVALIADMAVRSQVKESALAWLNEHAELAEPVLAKLSKSTSPAAPSAEKVLERMANQRS